MTALHLHGVGIPAETARTADDGMWLLESDTDRPLQRWRTETCKPVAPNPRCLCSHALTAHEDGESECWTPACGCSCFRLRPEEAA